MRNRVIQCIFAASVIVLTLVAVNMISAPKIAWADVPGLETKTQQATAGAKSVKDLAVACSSGKRALGGGYNVPFSAPALRTTASSPQILANGDPNAGGWIAEFVNDGDTSVSVNVWVICATIGA
jgi:hypothetical protein